MVYSLPKPGPFWQTGALPRTRGVPRPAGSLGSHPAGEWVGPADQGHLTGIGGLPYGLGTATLAPPPQPPGHRPGRTQTTSSRPSGRRPVASRPARQYALRNPVECPILRQGGARVPLVEFDPRVDELQAEVQRGVQQAAEKPRDQLFSEIWALVHAYTGRPDAVPASGGQPRGAGGAE